MISRKIEFIGEIPLNKVNLFVKLIHNMCNKDTLNTLHISSNDLILSLLDQHVEAIANEDVSYIDLENSVRNMTKNT